MSMSEGYKRGLRDGAASVTYMLAGYRPSEHMDCACPDCGVVNLLLDSIRQDMQAVGFDLEAADESLRFNWPADGVMARLDG